MKPKKKIAVTLVALIVLLLAFGAYRAVIVKTQVKELFRLNKELQQEGYYMAEFEFRMLGFSYLLDKGEYATALQALSDYHSKLKNREGLQKLPDFSSEQEEIAFFLDMQNPQTGAFIDQSAPYCVYWEVTQNVLNHIESLSQSSGVPLRLKYPLRFLDQINTPERLTVFLDDISYVGWIASKFPQTSFHFARNMLDCAQEGNVLERHRLYQFSPEWKHALLKWMYDFQDRESGMWGPKSRNSGKLFKLDLNNTASILKAYRDNDGNDLYDEFPLRKADRIFSNSLEILSEPYPAKEDELDAVHEWNLKKQKGFKMVLRYLWKDASEHNKNAMEELMREFVELSFRKYYVKSDGAFSFYPDAEYASADGFANMMFDQLGAFSYDKQKKLFGSEIDSVKNCGTVAVKDLSVFLEGGLMDSLKINSLRFYRTKPDLKHVTENVWVLCYLNDACVLDVTELVPNLVAWADRTSLSVGNWTSVAEKKKELIDLGIVKPRILTQKELERALAPEKHLYCVGFTVLQLPAVMFECNSE